MALLNDADALYLGSTEVAKVYKGSMKVWPAARPPLYAANHTTWWAEDIGLADGSMVGGIGSEWSPRHDDLGYGDLTKSVEPARPTLTVANTNLGSRATVNGDGGSQTLHSVTAGAATQPLTIVIVMHQPFDSSGAQSTAGHGVYREPRANFRYQGRDSIYAGSTLRSSVLTLTGALFVSVFSGGDSSLDIDGVRVTSGNAGLEDISSALSTHCTGAPGGGSPTQHSYAEIGLIQVIDGLLSAPELAELEAFSSDYYGN